MDWISSPSRVAIGQLDLGNSQQDQIVGRQGEAGEVARHFYTEGVCCAFLQVVARDFVAHGGVQHLSVCTEDQISILVYGAELIC